jgi:8-oxo-dGTP diphosphatase
VACVIFRAGRVLAGRRTEPPHLAGGWELPGGKVEAGESDEAALVREIAEELGVSVRLGARVGGDWPLGPYALRVWIAAIDDGGEPAPLEDHDLLAWVPLDDLDQVAWLAGDREPLAAAAILLRAGTL